MTSDQESDIDPSSLTHEDVVGRTATTVVHEARRTGGEGPTHLAVKHPARHGTLTDETVDRFQQEARQWAGLDDHANIVSVTDWGYDSLPWIRGDAPVPWIAMEAMTGPAFRTVAEHATVDESLWIARHIVDAVWHAHHRGVVHLDLKPSNVLFADRETDQWPIPKVADWEVSKSLLDSADEIGITTPGYFAPEQEHHETTDHRTDQFQLGIVLYELFTGTHPFVDDLDSAPEQERIAGVLEGNYTPPSQSRSEIPTALDDVFDRVLAKDPADRYEATIDLRRALERIEADRTLGGTPSTGSDAATDDSQGPESIDSSDDGTRSFSNLVRDIRDEEKSDLDPTDDRKTDDEDATERTFRDRVEEIRAERGKDAGGDIESNTSEDEDDEEQSFRERVEEIRAERGEESAGDLETDVSEDEDGEDKTFRERVEEIRAEREEESGEGAETIVPGDEDGEDKTFRERVEEIRERRAAETSEGGSEATETESIRDDDETGQRGGGVTDSRFDPGAYPEARARDLAAAIRAVEDGDPERSLAEAVEEIDDRSLAAAVALLSQSADH